MNRRSEKIWMVVWCLGVVLGCSTGERAGGVTEETNAIAGRVLDGQGKPVAGAYVEVMSVHERPVIGVLSRLAVTPVAVMSDTSDAQGYWKIELDAPGDYAVNIRAPGGAVGLRYVHCRKDSLCSISDTVRPPVALDLRLRYRWDSAEGSLVYIPGTRWSKRADLGGITRFDSVPQGSYPVRMESLDPVRYASVCWWVQIDAARGAVFYGPYPADIEISVIESQEAAKWPTVSPDSLEFPLDPEYGVRAWWNFDVLRVTGSFTEFMDARGRTSPGVVYDAVLQEGVQGHALYLGNSGAFGVLEDDGGILDSLRAFTIEAWVRVDSLGGDGEDRNLVGKLGFGSAMGPDVFSLYLSGSNRAFSMVLAQDDSTDLRDGYRVSATEPIVLGRWYFVSGLWDGERLCVSVNGGDMRCVPAKRSPLGNSRQVWIFGKENASVLLDDVKVYGFAVQPVDMRYRWIRGIP